MATYKSRNSIRLRMIVTGGGTGGHTFPILTTVATLRERNVDADVLWVGSRNSLEQRVACEADVPFRAIMTGKLRRSFGWRDVLRNVVDAFRIPIGVLQAIVTTVRTRPTVVFSTGGYVSFPIGFSARLLGVPYVLHEQTLGIGLANRVLARIATRVLLSHETSLQHLPRWIHARTVVTGNPIRDQILAGDPRRAVTNSELDHGLPLVLVLGGSGGARQVNHMVAGALPDLVENCQVVHQVGDLDHTDMRRVADALPGHLRRRYRVVTFIHDDLPDLLAAAEIVVSRSGAGTVAELAALGKAVILVPYPFAAGDEQRRAARYLADHGAAVMLDGSNANPPALLALVRALLADAPLRTTMAAAISTFGRRDAARSVVSEIVSVAVEK